MIKFLNGPAGGAKLDLRRAPHLLRVVIDFDGTVDALDQLDDVPKATETIHVYALLGRPSQYHVLCTPRWKSGWHLAADYRLHGEQPSEEIARDTHRWREWAARQRRAMQIEKEASS